MPKPRSIKRRVAKRVEEGPMLKSYVYIPFNEAGRLKLGLGETKVIAQRTSLVNLQFASIAAGLQLRLIDGEPAPFVVEVMMDGRGEVLEPTRVENAAVCLTTYTPFKSAHKTRIIVRAMDSIDCEYEVEYVLRLPVFEES